MQRKKFIYCVLPGFTLLSCGPMLHNYCGATLGLILTLLCAFYCWSVVWLRLFGANSLRPEFSVLAVCPAVITQLFLYYGADKSLFEEMPAIQTVYFFLCLAFAGIGIASMRATPAEKAALKGESDSIFIIMTVLILAFTLSSYASTASLFFIN